MNAWKVGEAKQQFSKVLRLAADTPQQVWNRDALVAVVIGAREAQEFLSWKQQKRTPSLSQALEEVRFLANEDNYKMIAPKRSDRLHAIGLRLINPFEAYP